MMKKLKDNYKTLHYSNFEISFSLVVVITTHVFQFSSMIDHFGEAIDCASLCKLHHCMSLKRH